MAKPKKTVIERKKPTSTTIAIGVCICLLLTTLGFQVCDGAYERQSYARGKCDTQWARWEYVIPAYRLGCWLGGAP